MKKENYKTFRNLTWIISVTLFVSLMVLFGLTDRRISTTIWNEDIQNKANNFNVVVSAIGATMLVLPIFFAIQGMIQKILTTKFKFKNGLFWLLNILLVLICLIINFWSMIHRPHDRVWGEWIIQIVLGVFYTSVFITYDILFWNSKRHDEKFINNYFWLALRTVIFLTVIFVIVNVMKPAFGRPRPIQVLKEANEYSYHYPFSISSYSSPRPLSFPSGHAISAMSIFGLTLMFCRKPGWKRYSINAALTIIVILVCIARILGLHHWASDTFMSIGIGTLAYNLCMKLFNNKLINE